MPIFRTEFKVFGDWVFDPEKPSEVIFSDTDFEITLSNGSEDAEGFTENLIAKVIGPASGLVEAEREHRVLLGQKLDFLSFCTMMRFEIRSSVRAIEWEPFATTRLMMVFYNRDIRYPPVRDFATCDFDTIRALSHKAPAAYIATALRYFRYAVLDKSSEDQFIKLWHALEIIAENRKSKEKISVSCRACNAPLSCSCGTLAERYPMAKEAIREIFEEVGLERPSFVFSKLHEARNTLMHGGSAESVERKAKKPLREVVNILASIVQAAILSNLEYEPGEYEIRVQGDLHLFDLLARVHMSFNVDASLEHPADDQIPKVDVSMLTELVRAADNPSLVRPTGRLRCTVQN